MSRFKVFMLASAAMVLSDPAWAAEAAAPSDGADTVSDVVVTASPIGVSEKAMTASVDVLDQKTLDLAPSATLGDLVASLPGVRSSSFAPGASRPVIRGLSGPRVQVLSNGLGMIDASALSDDHQVAADPSEAERIEVVRGPSTLAYGGSAIGGVVNIIDGRIPETPAVGGLDGRLNLQASSVDNGWSSSGRVKAGDGPWVFAVEGLRRESDDYALPGPAMSQRLADLLGVSRSGPHKVENSFAQLSEYGVGGSYVSDSGFAGLSVKQTKSDYGTVAEEDVTIQLRQTRVDARGRYDVNWGPFAQVRAAAGYADYEHTEYEGPDVGTRFLGEGWESRLELVQAERGAWRGAVGAQALSRSIDAIGDEALIPKTDVSLDGIYTVQRLDGGPIGFEGGLRVDKARLSNVIADRAFINVSGSAGVFVRPAAGLYLGLTVDRFQRAPNEIELFADGPHPATGQFQIGNSAFGSETATSLEFAVRYENEAFDADANVYYASYDGFIDLRPTGGVEVDSGLPIFVFVQTNAAFTGFEVEAGHNLWVQDGRSLRLEGQADLVRGETDLGPPARIPPWSLAARAIYTTPIWDAAVEVRHAAAQNRLAAYELPTDGYTLVNLKSALRPFRDRGVELFAELRNLTDEEAREHASALKDIAPMPGRNLRVGLNYRF